MCAHVCERVLEYMDDGKKVSTSWENDHTPELTAELAQTWKIPFKMAVFTCERVLEYMDDGKKVKERGFSWYIVGY